MSFPSNTSKTNMILLIIFLTVWTYTEITENHAREEFNARVFEFMVEIEHDQLKSRVEALEAGHE